MELSVAEKIRLIMRRQGKTMGELAELTGQTRQNLSNKMSRVLPKAVLSLKREKIPIIWFISQLVSMTGALLELYSQIWLMRLPRK